MDRIVVYNPFTDKDTKIKPDGRVAKRIYKLFIDDMGVEPEFVLPPNLKYIKKTGRFEKKKKSKDLSNVRRITYTQIPKGIDASGELAGLVYFKKVFANYAGQTIQVAITIDGVDRNQIEEIPPLGDEFNMWWMGFIYFLRAEESPYYFFSEEINKDLPVEGQGQLLILSFDKVDTANYSQYFAEGITNCLLQPIREWAAECYDNAKGKSAKYNYQRKLKLISGYEKEFVKGVPEERIPQICNELQIGIEIDLPSTLNDKTKFIDIRGQKCKKTFKYINTRLNHIDLNVIKSLDNYEEVTKSELMEIYNNEKNFKMWKQGRSGITQVNTLEKIYTLKKDVGYAKAVADFEELNNLNAYKVEHYDNPELSNFLRSNWNDIQSVLFCDDQYFDEKLDKKSLSHIDMAGSYTRGQDCPYYEGYLGKISDFRKTDKIQSIGIYQVKNINFNGNKLIEKLKVLHNYNAYPSPELKFYQSLGITFDIIGGCWGTAININYPASMYEKEEKLSHYKRWIGTLAVASFKSRYSFDCKDIEYAKLNHNYNDKVDIRFNDYDRSGIIEYKKKKVLHQCHILGFITSYARLNVIHQLQQFKDINNIVAVQVDGIYYHNEEVEMTKVFVKEKKNTIDYIDTNYFVKEHHNEEYNYPDAREYNQRELHVGAGGNGKTHYNLTDKGLCSCLYVAPPWKLARNKNKDYDVSVSVVAWLIDENPDKWRSIFNKYSTLIIDEASQISNEVKDIILERYYDHKIIFCGDMGYQLPPVMGDEFVCDEYDEIVTIEHNTNYRCRCPKLKKRLTFLREKISEGKKTLVLWENMFMGMKLVNRHNIDYNVNDLIICSTHKNKDEYTCKYKDLEKYMVLENTLDYSNGDIIYHKPEGVKYELRHAFTIHSIQGETATHKLYIDMRGVRCLRMLYTALSRARYLDQIILMT